MTSIRLALAQLNPTVGDLEGNADKIIDAMGRARKLGVDILAFPELVATGYPPEDLVLRTDFIEANLKARDRIVAASKGLVAIFGFVDLDADIFNAAAIAVDGRLADVYHKVHLPNYGVFDERRTFQAGRRPGLYRIGDIPFGVSICEDIWIPGGPAHLQSVHGNAVLLVNISASPYHLGKGEFRRRMLSTRASDHGAVVAYVNLVGGQDELVFDGASVVYDADGEILALGPMFEEDLVVVDVSLEDALRRRLHDPRRREERAAVLEGDRTIEPVDLEGTIGKGGGILGLGVGRKPRLAPREVAVLGELEEVYRALVTGLRDYVQKNRFRTVVIGLSGGIDSALTALLAVDALGPDNVVGITMPTRFSSEGTRTDAVRLAGSLGIQLFTVPIQEIFQSYVELLRPVFQDARPDVTEENLQARIRGNLLMAVSNKFGWLVLATGNKSEMSTGYCTLYGDMAGGFAVLKDVPKMLVYQLVQNRNSLAGRDLIPASIIERPPTAELREGQKDEDSLPPYGTLDAILKAYVEEDKSLEEIVALGFKEDVVRDVAHRVASNEYKRRQGPPGIKITPRAFGKDRRVPITNRFRLP